MDRTQHRVQDAMEHFAGFVMQQRAEQLGVAMRETSERMLQDFRQYAEQAGLTDDDFDRGPYRKYKENVLRVVPRFVDRLAEHHAGHRLAFEVDEKNQRDEGNKADVMLSVSGIPGKTGISIKNYIGGGGIQRPQVGSGTFLSFANNYVFERVGVGKYLDPRDPEHLQTFRGRDAADRDAVLRAMGRSSLIALLARLEELNTEMREELLADDLEMYDQGRVRAVVERIAPIGIDTVLTIFEQVGIDEVRERFLSAIGMDGKEEALFFDSDRYVDSITEPAYHQLRERLNDAGTDFVVERHLQNLRFRFVRRAGQVLAVDVPFTVNTNGAWYRPKERYSGTRAYNDKGTMVELRWGQRRPRKSREIATSTNTYLDLSKVGILSHGA